MLADGIVILIGRAPVDVVGVAAAAHVGLGAGGRDRGGLARDQAGDPHRGDRQRGAVIGLLAAAGSDGDLCLGDLLVTVRHLERNFKVFVGI